ncbi:MAG: class I SAM-dependent methyltransferase [Nocardioides sp.]
MTSSELWDEETARRYDADDAAMFAPEVLGPTVDLLADLAGAGRALELAVGTGRVGIALAERGVPVVGIELSPHMAARLREKVDEATLPVVLGDMATATAPGEFALVYLVYNTLTNLLTQAEQVACFRNAARHLAPGGRFVVECFGRRCAGCRRVSWPRRSRSARSTWASTPTTWSTSDWSPTTSGRRPAAGVGPPESSATPGRPRWT